MNKHKTRHGLPSIFTKTIGITPKDLNFIDAIRERKSKSGKLKEILFFYRASKK